MARRWWSPALPGGGACTSWRGGPLEIGPPVPQLEHQPGARVGAGLASSTSSTSNLHRTPPQTPPSPFQLPRPRRHPNRAGRRGVRFEGGKGVSGHPVSPAYHDLL